MSNYCPNCGCKQPINPSSVIKFCSSCGSGLSIGSQPRKPEPQHIDDEDEPSHIDIGSLDAEKFKNSVIIEIDRPQRKVTFADVIASPLDPNSTSPQRRADPLTQIEDKKAFLAALISESTTKRGVEIEGGD